jgi:hypothetical protein
VVSNLDSRPAEAPKAKAQGDHARASAVWLSGVHPKRTEGADVRGGKTIDQMAADVLGRDTQLRSLEIAAEDFTAVGGCDIGYACSYVNTLSWRTPTTPLPMQTDPRVVFERLFGEALGAEQRRRQLTQDQSILDAIVGQVGQLQKRLGTADTARVNEYSTACGRSSGVSRRWRRASISISAFRRCRSACRISTTTTSG